MTPVGRGPSFQRRFGATSPKRASEALRSAHINGMGVLIGVSGTRVTYRLSRIISKGKAKGDADAEGFAGMLGRGFSTS